MYIRQTMNKTAVRYLIATTGTLFTLALLCWYVLFPAVLRSYLPQIIEDLQSDITLQSLDITSVTLWQTTLTDITLVQRATPPLASILPLAEVSINRLTVSYSPATLINGRVKDIIVSGMSVTAKPRRLAEHKADKFTESMQVAKSPTVAASAPQTTEATGSAFKIVPLPPVGSIHVQHSNVTLLLGDKSIKIPFSATYLANPIHHQKNEKSQPR